MISGNVKKIEIDENGNLKVETEYTLTDGSKKLGHTRYSALNFSKDKVLEDVKAHTETLMQKTYNLKQNQTLVNTKVDDISYQCTELEITVKPAELDKDGNVVTPAEKIIINDN